MILKLVNRKIEIYKYTVIIILFAGLILISNSLISFFYEYNNIDKQTKDRVNVLVNLGKRAIEVPLWDIDQNAIINTAKSLFSDKEVGFVEIESNGYLIYSKKMTNLEAFKPKYMVFATQDVIKAGATPDNNSSENQPIGTIKIGITKYYMQHAIIKNIFNSIFVIIITLLLVYLAINAIIKQEKYNKEKIRSILDNMVDSVIIIDSNLVIKSCNQATEKMFEYKLSDIIGSKFDKFVSINKSLYNKINDNFLEFCELGISENINGIRVDGTLFPVEFNVGTIDLDKELLYIIVVRDITIRHEVNKMKDEFISTVSHELRTPLTSINGSIELILAGVCGEISDKVSDLLHIVNRNGKRLINLINDILDLEKIVSGKIQFNNETHSISKIVEKAIEDNTSYANQFNFKLELINSLPEIKVFVDQNRLIQILTNLISNAIKFSGEYKTVQISMESSVDKVRINVKNYGEGVPEEFKSKIFQKFAQADSSDSRQKGGTGLGLNICKNLVELMNGNIGFVSEPNKETIFYIELPIVKDK